MTPVPRSPVWLIAAAGLWMALVCNGALWRELHRLGLLGNWQGWAFAAALVVIIWSALCALLALAAWRLTLKPAVTVLLLASALASHFMLNWRVIIDAHMIDNILQTDAREAAALLDGRMAVSLLVLALIPCVLIWRQPLQHGGRRRQALRSAAVLAAALAVLGLAIVASFQPLASVARNHKEVRYFVNPLSSIAALARVAGKPWQRDMSTLVAIGQDARLGNAHAARVRPPLLLLVLGETGRSGNFGINGYARATTPQLQREQLASFRNAWSCGTSTAMSVPCMFSNLTRAAFDDRKTQFEGLLDVLQRAGLAVLWIDNQAGCKGVCDRVPNVSTSTSTGSSTSDVAALCSGGECLDEIMLSGIDARIAALDPVRRARGVVLVMHQMGSHGPAYHLRSPPAQKRFLPECKTTSLQDCSRDSIVNAYDNTIAYTDHFLARCIAWLKQQAWADTAMLYVADHGESLGENNLYLHGLPYAIAPDVQKRVPWITWFSTTYLQAARVSLDCLRAQADVQVSHDNYFHSVLGLLDVETAVYRQALDAYALCRGDVK